MTFGSLFSGIGGMDLGLERAGMECKWQVEIKEFPRKVLAKHWPNVTRFEDVRSLYLFDAEGWRFINVPESVSVLCGGFPCQDISHAGKGIGIIGGRSGLWSEFARLVAELRPAVVFAENVPALRNRGLALVLQDLWSLGYDAEWNCIPASAFGAPHERDRIWIVAYSAAMFRQAVIGRQQDGVVPANGSDANVASIRRREGRPWGSDTGGAGESKQAFSDSMCEGRNSPQSFGPGEAQRAGSLREPIRSTVLRGGATDDDSTGREEQWRTVATGEEQPAIECCGWWATEPGVLRMVHGVPDRVDRLTGLGNAVVPQVAEWLGRRILESLVQDRRLAGAAGGKQMMARSERQG